MEMLIEYFSYPFVRYAVIVGVLIAFCSSLLGVTLVLKRMSYIGDGLSHVAFGALAIALKPTLPPAVFSAYPSRKSPVPVMIEAASPMVRSFMIRKRSRL